MKRILFFLMLAVPAGAALAAEGIEWDDARPEFKFFTEKKHFTQKSWEELSPADQNDALKTAEEAALQRQQEVRALYSQAQGKWDLQRAQYFTGRYTEAELRAVYLWVGQEDGHELAHKVVAVRDAMSKAAVQPLTDADTPAIAPYLTAEAIAELKSLKAAEDLKRQAAGQFKKYEIPKETSNAAMKGVAGAVSGDVNRNMAKAFDGNMASGEANAPAFSKAYSIPKGAIGQTTSDTAGQFTKYTNAGINEALMDAQRTTTAKTIKSAAPVALDEAGKTKSKAWTSDAYGITVKTSYGDKSFRDPAEAEAYIRSLPVSTIKEVRLYGHGSPGMQTVGPAMYDANSTAEMLKGKMAGGGVINFVGCNTASIGDSTLNPAVGLSMVARRLLYFSVPYWSDRINGTPADQAKQQWEKEWNADLARDTSINLAASNNVIVCGYRTFGLVPGRLPVLTKVLGTQEETDPTLIVGKKVCYRNGKEVPAP